MPPSDDLLASWARSERSLRAALADLDVTSGTHAWVTEHLDANELGLAFECLVEYSVESGIVLSPTARRELSHAAVEMNLDDNAAWLALKALPPGFDDPSQ